MLNASSVILDTTSVASRIRDHNVCDAQRTGELVVLADGEACGCATRCSRARDSQRQSVFQPGKVQWQISSGDDALDACPVVHVQIIGEIEGCDFRWHCPDDDIIERVVRVVIVQVGAYKLIQNMVHTMFSVVAI